MSGEPSHSAATGPFRICGSCQEQWASEQDFVLDPDIRLLGLQVVPNLPDGNLLVFGHCCGTSISLFAKRLRQLMPDPEDDADLPVIGYEECVLNCRGLEDLARCDRPCPKARDRRLVQVILKLKYGSK